jgi:hypothetical protein
LGCVAHGWLSYYPEAKKKKRFLVAVGKLCYHTIQDGKLRTNVRSVENALEINMTGDED